MSGKTKYSAHSFLSSPESWKAMLILNCCRIGTKAKYVITYIPGSSKSNKLQQFIAFEKLKCNPFVTILSK